MRTILSSVSLPKEIEKLRRPDAILSADWHLREDTPECRQDDFLSAQFDKLTFLKMLQSHWGEPCVPILVAGDLLDFWKPSPWLLGELIDRLPRRIYAIPGQHDLPQHNLNLLNKTGFRVLLAARAILPIYGNEGDIIPGVPVYGRGFGEEWPEDRGEGILVGHRMVWTGAPPFPGADPKGSARTLLKKFSGCELILTGDNHQAFVTEEGSRILVNPGPLTRQTADEEDFVPRVYLWYKSTAEALAEAFPIFLPVKKGVVSRNHLERVEQRDARLEVFVKHLQKDYEVGLSFERNLKGFLRSNKVPKRTEEFLWKFLG